MSQPVIIAARRTPIGRFLGALSRTPSPRLGAYAIEAVLNDVPGAREHVDECIMGCVLQAGVGQNPARQAGLGAGLPETLSAVTVNKVCGSGLQAVMQAAQAIRAGDAELIVAGGLENMSLAPHMAQVRQGIKYGSGELVDHMAADGLTCPFECWPMGNAAEHTARNNGIERGEQDRYSVQSHHRAAKATAEGWFRDEIIALSAEQLGQKTGCDTDEGFRADTTIDAMGKLRPAFDKAGSVTAGNASQISDGAAALLIASEERAKALGIEPLARIVGSGTAGVAPKELFEAPRFGIAALLGKLGLTVADIDLFELNEAFAAQLLSNIKALGISEDRLNVGGGSIALGHPIGASGARILVTLLHHLKRTDAKRGVASLCLGGGNAVSMVVERG